MAYRFNAAFFLFIFFFFDRTIFMSMAWTSGRFSFVIRQTHPVLHFHHVLVTNNYNDTHEPHTNIHTWKIILNLSSFYSRTVTPSRFAPVAIAWPFFHGFLFCFYQIVLYEFFAFLCVLFRIWLYAYPLSSYDLSLVVFPFLADCILCLWARCIWWVCLRQLDKNTIK